MHHYLFFDFEKCLDGFKIVFFFPYIFFTIAGLLLGLGYKKTFKKFASGNSGSARCRAKELAVNWGQWSAVLIYLFPLFDYEETKGLGHMAAHLFGMKTAAWLYFGFGLSLLIGFIAWTYFMMKQKLSQSAKTPIEVPLPSFIMKE